MSCLHDPTPSLPLPSPSCTQIMPGVKVAIVNPDNKMFCANTDLGEVVATMGVGTMALERR